MVLYFLFDKSGDAGDEVVDLWEKTKKKKIRKHQDKDIFDKQTWAIAAPKRGGGNNISGRCDTQNSLKIVICFIREGINDSRIMIGVDKMFVTIVFSWWRNWRLL